MRVLSLIPIMLFALGLDAQDSTEAVLRMQDTSLATAGDELRITAPSLGFHDTRGTLISIRNDSVRWRIPGPGSATIPTAISSVTSLAINHGNLPPHRNALPGAAVGLLSGALAGYVRDKIVSTNGACPNICTEDGEPVGGGFVGAIAGTLAGAGIGWLIKTGSYAHYDRDAIRNVLLVPTWDASQRAVGLLVAAKF